MYWKISTGCCPESVKYKAIFLSYPLWAGINFTYKSVKPEWYIEAVDPEHGSGKSIVAHHCPFCGSKVPKIELNPKTKKLKIHDSKDGDYCVSCKQRNMECRCLPPQYRWRPKGVEVEIPVIEQNEEED